MPMIPATSINYAQLILRGVVASAGSTARNMNLVMNYLRTTNVNPVNKTNIAAAWITAHRTLFLTCVSLRLTLSGLGVRFIDDATDAEAITTDVHAGLVVGDSMPLTQAAYLKCETGFRGRNYRGSHHLFPLGESATTVLTDDIFNAAALVYLGNFAAAYLAGMTDSDGNIWKPVVLSRQLSQIRYNPTNIVANQIISVSVAKRVGVMRHRRVAQLY